MKKLRFSHVLSDYILNLIPLEIILILYMYMYMLFLLFCMFIKRIDVCSSDPNRKNITTPQSLYSESTDIIFLK